jgi:hypothetical protein
MVALGVIVGDKLCEQVAQKSLPKITEWSGQAVRIVRNSGSLR